MLEGPPAEHGAFDALGKFLDAFEERELTEGVFVLRLAITHDDAAEVFTHGGGGGGGSAFDLHGHHGSAGLADGTALAGEFDVGDVVLIVELHPDVDLVTAGRIVAMGVQARRWDLAVVPRFAGVIEDDGLVEIAELFGGHGGGLREEFPGGFEHLGEAVDLLRGVVEIKAGTGGAGDFEALHERLGAVMAAAHGDAVGVGPFDDVVRVGEVAMEGDEGASWARCGAEDTEAFDGA